MLQILKIRPQAWSDFKRNFLGDGEDNGDTLFLDVFLFLLLPVVVILPIIALIPSLSLRLGSISLSLLVKELGTFGHVYF
jgi:hypothetical protein